MTFRGRLDPWRSVGDALAVSEDDAAQRHADLIERLGRDFATAVPHNMALGIGLRDLREGRATFVLPYRADLVGNAETGVVHGGAITALVDACCGAAVFMALRNPKPIATLDLRIDYLGPATPGEDVVAEAECLRVTRHVAFARCTASLSGSGAPIAYGTATFMLGTSRVRREKTAAP